MGTNSAAGASAGLRMSYGSVKLALIVGICGGLPQIAQRDAFLGDVIISSSIVQYDYGRQYPGRFAVKNTIEDSLARASRGVRGLLAQFRTELGRERLQSKSAQHLTRLQDLAKRKRRRAKYQRPDRSQDHAYEPAYMHRHRADCTTCSDELGIICDPASEAACTVLGCEESARVARDIQTESGDYEPEIFIGRVGSGNTVMKSGLDRDRIANQHKIIAFEMEGAGAWDEMPCLVIKGICDYADSHKNKDWQDFAAATAAAVARAVIERCPKDDDPGAKSKDSPSRGTSGSGLQRPDAGSGASEGGRTISNNTFASGANINQGNVYGGSMWSK
ncbi:hypothetical protein ACHAQA_006136 [Verticillium albo-atrum]